MEIGLISNKKQDPKSLEANKFSKKVALWLRSKGHEAHEKLNDKILRRLDFVITLGGDGLVLDTADRVSRFELPIFRVNFGHRGFLANIEPKEIFASLERILKGDFHIEERNRIAAEIFHGNKIKKRMDALNEIAVGGINRTVSLRLKARQGNKNFSVEAHGDGLLVSTRTGSTAYNINAGGPMLCVENIFSITANNAFFRSDLLRMNIKSFVAPDDSEFEIEIINQNELNLPYAVADGQRGYKLKKGDYLAIKKSSAKTLFLEIGKEKK